MYEIVPGFAINLLVAWLVSLKTYRRNEQVQEEFTEMENELGVKVTA